MRNYRKILIGLLLLVGLSGVSLVYAQGLVPCTGAPCDLCDLWQMSNNIVDLGLKLATAIGALLFVAAGVIFLTAGGNEQKLALAKTIFYDTIVGLIIIFCSWLLIDTIFNSLASGAFSGPWNKFPTCK